MEHLPTSSGGAVCGTPTPLGAENEADLADWNEAWVLFFDCVETLGDSCDGEAVSRQKRKQTKFNNRNEQ